VGVNDFVVQIMNEAVLLTIIISMPSIAIICGVGSDRWLDGVNNGSIRLSVPQWFS